MNDEVFVNKTLKGVGVSSGIAIGSVYLLERGRIAVNKLPIREDQIERETAKFKNAIKVAIEELDVIKKSIPDDEMRKHAFIIDAHMLILQDNFFVNDVTDTIRTKKINAEWAPRHGGIQVPRELREDGRSLSQGAGTGHQAHL